MSGTYAVFENFNRIEAFIWFGAAAALPFLIKTVSRKQRLAIFGASIGFVIFGITDLLEAPTHGKVPNWLWGMKILCAAFLLSCRFTYLGWKNFRITDRWFVFGVICLAMSLIIFSLD